MYGVYLYTYAGDMTVTVTNLIAGTYNVYLYGHGNTADENGVFQLSVGSLYYGSEATINGSGWLSAVWQEGVQYVEFTNVSVVAGQTIAITVEPGASDYALLSGLQMALLGAPSIVTQPANQAVSPGSTATFSVVVQGVAPLAYQWRFNSADISGATNSSYSVANAEPANAGSYSVIVTNAHGSVTSAVAILTFDVPPAALIDVAFTVNSVTTKTGFAAIGVTSNDFWNTCEKNTGSMPRLESVDGTVPGAELTFSGAPYAYGNGSSDPMYGVYLYIRLAT